MSEEAGIEGYEPITKFSEDSLFKLQCLIEANEIQQSAQCEYGKKLFLAFTTGNSEIILYFKQEPAFTPVIKRIPWFQGLHKQISALCFHPLGTWLLCASLDGSLHIIPALSVVKENSIIDTRWNTEDITSFPPMNSQSSHSKPTAIVWWQDIATPADVAIIGTEYGEIVFTNLENGHQMALTHINAHIVTLHICRDQSNESTLLLITSDTNRQWRLLLERYNYSCLGQSQNDDSYNGMQSSESIYDNPKSFATTRSRLQGLKQMSVEKLAILRQKLIESRNQCSSESARFDLANNRNASNTSINSDSNSDTSQTSLRPEPIAQDAFLMSQCDREGQQLYTCYHANSNYITVHGPDSSAVPLSVHKVFSSCRNILLTERFFFVTDKSQRTLYVISDRLSESRTTENCAFNPECIVGRFSLGNSKETIRAVYRATDFTNEVPKSVSQDVEGKYTLPRNIMEVKVDLPPVDTCLIVTNYSVYKIVLRKSLVTIFMDIVLRSSEIEKAMQFASVFGMNVHQLLEQAGDILLCNKEFSRAVICYKLSKCKMLKNVLKFSSNGYTSDLLSCLIHWLVLPAISELPVATRMHLSNLCVLAFIEMTLRIAPQKSKAVYKEFLFFLSTNTFYDEVVAVKIAGRTCLWEVLHHLATQRGLYGQMLDVLLKTVHSYSAPSQYPSPYTFLDGLLICMSEPCLMQAMLTHSNLGRNHMSFVLDSLQDSQIFVLQRLVALYDPTNPVIRPRIVRSRARHRTTSHSSQSSQCDSIDLTDDEGDTLIEEMVEAFLLILLTLIYKRLMLRQEYPLTCNNKLLELRKDYHTPAPIVDFKRRPLSCGFSHVVLIRNGNVYTWGSSVQGCLGTGPSVLRYGTPQPITFFRTMQVEVLSVSCGHCHTVAVTNNGIYTWGSSQFGQLGLGKLLRCSSPELVTSLAQEVVTDCVAGQYHSVALTVDGRVFTWGWGVHGQLGHGTTDQKNIPTLVTSLLGVVIRHIAAGHAHTLALSTDGVVYAFGCNLFGQLGVGTNVKSSVPMKVSLTERINLIATGYFHNLAISNTNKLYVWGASPQVLRLQAQAQKKMRIQEHQEALERQEMLERQQKAAEAFDKMTDDNDINDDTIKQNDKANKIVQTKSNVNEVRRKVLDHATLKSINVGMLEESQAHLKPTLVDTSFVRADIIQITTGCHHNALVTKDGSLYTWGRNLDGQIGNGTKREVTIPMPLFYNHASIFTQIPPRQKKSEDEQEFEALTKNAMNERNGNIMESRAMREDVDFKERTNPVIKTVGVFCGYDFTVAIQPGGTVLAWGNNSKAQLGRLPAKDLREDKLVLLKSAKRVIRPPHVALDVPSQVPNIPASVISYQSYDVPAYAGVIPPLSAVEKLPGELTLHFALEYFAGLYDSSRIMEKCIQLGNYQACAKLAMLQHNVADAVSYQLKVLNAISLRLASSRIAFNNAEQSRVNKKSPAHNYKKNTEIFNKQVEKNLIESAEDCVARNKMRIPASKSLNSLQAIQDEYYTFDCQGGSEELSREVKCNQSLDISEDALDSDLSSDSEEWMENITSDDSRDNSTASTPVEPNDGAIDSMKTNNFKEAGRNLNAHKISLMNEAVKVIKFYLVEMEHEPDTIKYKILQDILDFWTEHNLPLENLESVFREHIDIVFYPLGLLLFCQEIMEKYLDANRNNPDVSNSGFTNLFSFKFCIDICSMLLEHVDQDQPAPEYIKLLSSLAADHYGSPLTGYPGSSGNNTCEQMMEGVISTISSDKHDSRSFVHIKDPDAVYRFLETDGNTMVFTCGHHFPLGVYEAEVIPTMETELLTSESVVLPCTAQFLGKTLSQSGTPEILCPQCVPRALGSLVKKRNE